MGSGCNRDTGLRPGLALNFFVCFACFLLVVWFDLAFGSENNSWRSVIRQDRQSGTITRKAGGVRLK